MVVDLLTLAAPGVQKLQPYQPGKPVSELQRELGLDAIIKLASNENPLGPSPKAAAALRDNPPDLAEYPDGNGFELKSAIAARHGLQTSQVTLGNGSNDILELLARAFLTPDHAALFSEHAFAVYPLATMAVGAECRVAPARDYAHDLDAMLDLIDAKVRLIFIANPNNPTGHWIDAATLRAFIEQVPQDVIVVVDEAYAEYVEEADYPDSTTWLNDFPNLVVTRTFSKIYGLAALRVGYGVSHPDVADLLNRVRQPFNCNAMAQTAALAALDDAEHVRLSRVINSAGLQQWRTACDDMGLSYLPSVGNFLTINLGRDGQTVFEAMLREGVIVRAIANYGLPEFIRVTIGNEAQNTTAIAALRRVISK